MKTKQALMGAVLTCILMTFSARAIVLFQDQFPYPPDEPIAVASGGNGQTAGGGTWVSGAGSLYGTTPDVISAGGSMEIMGTGVGDLVRCYFTNGFAGQSYTAVPLFTNTVYYFLSNAPCAGIYASFYLTVDSGAFATNNFGSSGNAYFAYFCDTNFSFAPRFYLVTNGAAPGAFRVAIENQTSVDPVDMYPNNAYLIVARLIPATGQATIWVSPSFETDSSFTSTATAQLNGITTSDAGGVLTTANFGICGFGVRNFSSGGPLYISSLTVGTTFADVVYGADGNDPIFFAVQPQNTTNFAGQPATLTVVAGGDDDTKTYQWSYNGTAIPGATLSSLSFGSLSTTNTGSYNVLVANAASPSGVTSSSAYLNVLASDVAPTIVSGPTNVTTTAGTSATFSVNATDSGAPLSYQWFFGSTAIAGETTKSLTISSLVFANAGTYKVTVTNPNGDNVTSSNATLVVNPPSPTLCTIQYLRSLLDTNYNTNANFYANGGLKLWTVTGTNTTWENLTSSGNSEFYIQDATAGVTVFWSGAAAASHMPPAGAVVTVTGPISDFDGLLELEPVFTNTFHSVTWSNVGPLPTPLPLPFDTTITGNPDYMQRHLVGEYFGATNVFLDTATGALFGNNANEPLTNDQPANVVTTFNFYNATNATKGTNFTVKGTNVNGAVFNVIFYNDHTDILNAVKPVGPVTVYGDLGIFDAAPPYTNGYELTPTRLADFVPAVSITNVISNVIRQGDLATNSFSTTVLMPGEKLTMTVVAHDPGGGAATISGLSGTGTWGPIVGNGTTTARVTYTYTATVGAEGTADTPGLTAGFSSSGWVGNYSNINTIYVPTAAEQKIRITELLASPTSNTNSPAYDPLNRQKPETGTISSQDQYIEIVNFNTNTSVNINRWTLVSGTVQVYQFVLGESLSPNYCGVLYGGPSGTDNDPPALNSPSMSFFENNGNGLQLSSSGGTLALYNLSGYLIDRVTYPSSSGITGSLCRMLEQNGTMVPQAYVNTNLVTPGYQFDETAWNATNNPLYGSPTRFGYGNPLNFSFTATPGQVSTLWSASSVTNQFNVVTGKQFTNSSGSFTVTNPPPAPQFYFITTP